MTKSLSLLWLLLTALIAYEAFKTIYSMVFWDGRSALGTILIFAAILSGMNFIFLWRSAKSLFVYIITAIFLMYFMALFTMGESEGIYRLLISLPGMTLCVATLVVASRFKL